MNAVLQTILMYMPIVASIGISLFVLIPILNTHIALGKRRIITILILELLGVGAMTSWFLWLGDSYSWYFWYSLVVGGVLWAGLLLRHLDYYLEAILAEISICMTLLFGLFCMELVWELGIVWYWPLTIVKILWVLIPLLLWGILRTCIQNVGTKIAAAIYIVLSLVKWILFPHWGVISIVLLFVYSHLAGYVWYWLYTTTRAEKVLSNNVSNPYLWVALVGLLGILVITF